ncbi:hypothetical protein D3C78_1925110 [compost metagenome]
MFVDPERTSDQTDLSSGENQGVILSGQSHQYHELIATDTRQAVVAAQILAQAQGDFAQQ